MNQTQRRKPGVDEGGVAALDVVRTNRGRETVELMRMFPMNSFLFLVAAVYRKYVSTSIFVSGRGSRLRGTLALCRM